MVWPGQPQSQQERHWTNCQHDLHTSCQQHLGCSVKEWWVTDVLGNASICPFSKYIPCETMNLNGCHTDTFLLKNLASLHISMLLVVITTVNRLKHKTKSGSTSRQVLEEVFRSSHICWKEDSWWLASGYAGRKSIRRSGIPLVQSSGDIMLVHHLVGALFKFCTVFTNR